MKLIDIAFKDISHTFRSLFSLVMMFGAPLLITGLLYFAFGGLAGGGNDFDMPVTRVQVVNLDQPDMQSNAFSAGEMLVEFLQNEDLAGVLKITIINDESAARAAVDSQQAGVAMIIPPGFSAAALAPNREAAVTLYQDPTLTIGPAIVKDLVNHFLDGFSGSKIAANVTVTQLSSRNITAGPTVSEEIARQYSTWLGSSGHDQGTDAPAGLEVRSPAGQAQPAGQGAEMIGPIMAGMIVFFVFFIGANGAESIVREDEAGTLARLFTTPTSQADILGGKFFGVIVSLIIQVAVLLFASMFIFSIDWGRPLAVGLVALGLIFAAAGFGVMLMAFIKNTRQTGPVLGGVLTLTGMLGGLFTTGIPNLPAAFDTATLAMPQGWAMRGWKLALAGAGLDQLLLPVMVMLVMGAVFFAVGVLFFRKRFA
jgi:ABC-2 type transport system permease protein